jgi:hypothetical protein
MNVQNNDMTPATIIIIIIIATATATTGAGTTALCEPWPSSKLFAILPYSMPQSFSSLHPGF